VLEVSQSRALLQFQSNKSATSKHPGKAPEYQTHSDLNPAYCSMII